VAMWLKNCINFGFLHLDPNCQNLVVFLKLGLGGNIGYETRCNIMNNFNLKHLNKFQWRIIRIGLWGIFWNPSYGCPWTIPKIILEINISISSLTTSIFLNNYFPLFLITTSIWWLLHSFSLSTNMDMEKILTCIFSYPWNVY